MELESYLSLSLIMCILQDLVLAGTGFTDIGKLVEMFVGYHVTYAIGECKLVSNVNKK
jgi:hypothetical protein